MNKLFIIGNLTKDPEMRSTRDGIPVCTFTVAVNRRQRGAEAGQQTADFFRITVWRQLAEICSKYLAKGRKVSIVGSISVSTFTGNDGTTKATMEVTADDVEFLTPKGEIAPIGQTVGEIDKKSGFVQVDVGEELPF